MKKEKARAVLILAVMFVAAFFGVLVPNVHGATPANPLLVVTAYDNTMQHWTATGKSPYLGDADSSNYIHAVANSSGKSSKWYTFNTTSLTQLTGVELWVYGKVSGTVTYDHVKFYNNTGILLVDASVSSWTTGYVWRDEGSVFTSWNTISKVNSAKIGLVLSNTSISAGTVYVSAVFLALTGSGGCNLQVEDCDYNDKIISARVDVNNGSDQYRVSGANGWANYTGISSSTVTIKVKYFGYWVNGTFTLTMGATRTITVRCKIYDVMIKPIANSGKAYLVGANVTAFNGTGTSSNKIITAITNKTGYAGLTDLPNATLRFIIYAKSSSLIIQNTTQAISSDDYAFGLTPTTNSLTTNSSCIMLGFTFASILVIPRKKKKNKKEVEQ